MQGLLWVISAVCGSGVLFKALALRNSRYKPKTGEVQVSASIYFISYAIWSLWHKLVNTKIPSVGGRWPEYATVQVNWPEAQCMGSGSWTQWGPSCTPSHPERRGWTGWGGNVDMHLWSPSAVASFGWDVKTPFPQTPETRTEGWTTTICCSNSIS